MNAAWARNADALAIWAPLQIDAIFNPNDTALDARAALAEEAVLAAEAALSEVKA